MADIVDPKAISYVQDLRKIAALAELTITLARKAYLRYWGEGINAVLPDTADVVADGNTAKPVTGAQATACYGRVEALVTDADANGYARLQIWMALSELDLGVIED